MAEIGSFLFFLVVEYLWVMQMKGKEWLFAFVMGIVLPGLIFSVAEKTQSKAPTEPTESSSEIAQIFPTQMETALEDMPITVLLSDGAVAEMSMDTYLTGVVLGEMPVSFDIEALKAQAVVARTYTLRRSSTGQKHNFGAVCTESSCCQAYCSVADYLSMGGTQDGVNKVLSAIRSTADQVLTYQDTLIEATYFSCSGGRTEDAMAVWGTDIPYLQAVDSPGEENATHYTDAVQFTAKEFASLLGISSAGAPSKWLGSVTYTEGGGVATMEIAGTVFKGTTIRQKLGLRSTAFTIMAVGNNIHISTKGFGHRVGMSQYGAEAMAVKGSDYREILSHYYPGTTLKTYSQN